MHALLALLAVGVASAQTTQGLIAGRVVHAESGRAVAGAEIRCVADATGATAVARADSSGNFALPLLSPGSYRIRAAAAAFQPQEVHELVLAVAGRLDLEFRLRPLSDLWEAGQYRSVFLPGSQTVITFYGPDVDPSRSASITAARGASGALESTLSQVIDPAQVRELPLAGRDVYTALVVQPAVTADTTTARGLGLSVAGRRPSSSNFLLDGVENNDYLVTGPLSAVAPEAVSEYRISTSNFSAQYGGTAGFIANAVTRAGGNAFHGLAYLNFKNDALHANGFQQNLAGLPRPPAKEAQAGYFAGGPVRRQRVFFSSALERLRGRSRGDPMDRSFPSASFAQDFTAPGSLARSLLQQFPSPAAGTTGYTATRSLQQPASVDRWLALERGDALMNGGGHRLLGRVAAGRLSRPDFIWSPYPDFVSGMRQNTLGVVIALQSALRPNLMNETRAGWNHHHLVWDRAHPEIPTLLAGDATLPGSPAFYAFRNRSRGWQVLDNLTWVRRRHLAKAGGGVLLRGVDVSLTAGRDGLYEFPSLFDFALDAPSVFTAMVSRQELPAFRLPDYDRGYAFRQWFLFAQDAFHATSRLAFDYGVRYENFGAPRNTARVNDARIELGSGDSFAQRLAAARLVPPSAAGRQLYSPDNNNWAIRLGFAYGLRRKAHTLLRGSYGIFYDRPFDNLWQNVRNNDLGLLGTTLTGARVDYLAPIADVLRGLRQGPPAFDFPRLVLFQPDLRDAYVHSYFLGVQQQVGERLAVEVNTLGSLGRKGITTDIVNRPFSLPRTAANPAGRFNPALGDVTYRGTQGISDYAALAAVARYRSRHAQFQASYTWSHSIDNQSDPLAGDFFDLTFTRISAGEGRQSLAAFTRQFDSRGDRGNSDFDQRHNLVFFSIWESPGAGRLLRNWRISQLAAFRTGFPFTVTAPSSGTEESLIDNRADIIDPRRTVLDPPAALPGGRQWLQAAGFSVPAPGRVGNSGRNAFRGPGLFNVDLSLSRSFVLPRLGEAGRVVLRADAFNILNHANLNNPGTLLGSAAFGQAAYGRLGRAPGFPGMFPLNETARQIQLIFRVEW